MCVLREAVCCIRVELEIAVRYIIFITGKRGKIPIIGKFVYVYRFKLS